MALLQDGEHLVSGNWGNVIRVAWRAALVESERLRRRVLDWEVGDLVLGALANAVVDDIEHSTS